MPSSATVITTTDGLRLAVQVSGPEGAPVVVAVHGYPDDHTVWDGVVGELAATHRVATYDVRGAGASDAPGERAGYGIERLAADLRAVVDEVSPGAPVHLLAHDWGSTQAWHAVTHGALDGRVASFTSISGPSREHVAAFYSRARRRDRVRQALASCYMVLFRAPVLPELGWRSGLIGAVMSRRAGVPRPRTADAVRGLELYRENIGGPVGAPIRTDVPVQVLAPADDPFVTPALQTQIALYVDDLQVRTVPGGHWLSRERPDVVARCVRELAAHVGGAAEAPSLRRARTVAKGVGRWAGRVVVVTGAGSGIGRAVAHAFGRRGALVVAADRNLATAKETAFETGGLAYEVDVSDGDAMAAFADRVAAEAGVPDVVVNNAGIAVSGPFADTGVEDWEAILDVNLWGVIHGCRLFGAQLREHGEGGHIVNVASAAAFTPVAGLPAYCTTKAAVLMLSECLRAELAGQGIGVTALCPAFVPTDIVSSARMVGVDESTAGEQRRSANALIARRNYPLSKVAELVVRAVEKDVALAPVTPEAHVALALSRLTPGLLRAAARTGQ
ncbi:MAG: short-chain dehydrogenase/reductase [Pseudonocardia sp.]|jgi:NAD(P)-dependent dehydrogenase (short-subunit alcohol dehydrogenase family)/pimeloyl-ACP methyl ester carboxylesterase|uniref:SDR family oxidoreductase n=1 Tax=Pseudonocardia sp. TaxID=60912 RepID=UPI00262B41F5|nr:SDR family oxidoreductase [Pseudonocardia sp.]MCU1630930.1 short-chain dehydrogenase/reductase [Pseudonocardia sp.]